MQLQFRIPQSAKRHYIIAPLILGHAVLLSACGRADGLPTEQAVVEEATTSDAIISFETLPNERATSIAEVEAITIDEPELSVDQPELDQLGSDFVVDVPQPTALSAVALRAGFVSLQWEPSEGDVFQTQTSGDSVSYYRVYRNSEFYKDTLVPYIEDNSPPPGDVVYSVEAQKFFHTPEFVIQSSSSTSINVLVPTFEADATRFAGQQLAKSEYQEHLQVFQRCDIAYQNAGSETLCANTFGYAWAHFNDGSFGDLLPTTTSVATDSLVIVRNNERDLGVAPGLPTWSVKNFSTGITQVIDMHISAAHLGEGEGHVVNGVAATDDGRVFISGTVYQGYLPRNLGIEVGVLPVTNAYYLAQFDATTGDLLQFKRYSLEEAPGAAVAVSNGLLEMHKVGQVALYDTATLTQQSSLSVSGYPVFGDNDYVYTKAFGPESFYRFKRHVN